jgi:hypothetical protein
MRFFKKRQPEEDDVQDVLEYIADSLNRNRSIANQHALTREEAISKLRRHIGDRRILTISEVERGWEFDVERQDSGDTYLVTTSSVEIIY